MEYLPRCTAILDDGTQCSRQSSPKHQRGWGKVHAGPICQRHYRIIKEANTETCREAGCKAVAHHMRRCRQHEVIPLHRLDEEGRAELRSDFLAVITPDWETGCWLFNGQTVDGYGRLQVKGAGTWTTHRLAWHLFYLPHENGTVTNPVECDHLCGRSLCCSPVHLRPATKKANIELRERRGPDWDWRADVAQSPITWELRLFATMNNLPLLPGDRYAEVVDGQRWTGEQHRNTISATDY